MGAKQSSNKSSNSYMVNGQYKEDKLTQLVGNHSDLTWTPNIQAWGPHETLKELKCPDFNSMGEALKWCFNNRKCNIVSVINRADPKKKGSIKCLQQSNEVGRDDYALCTNESRNNTVENCDQKINEQLETYNENPTLPEYNEPHRPGGALISEVLDSANDRNYGAWTLKDKTDGKIYGNVFRDRETINRIRRRYMSTFPWGGRREGFADGDENYMLPILLALIALFFICKHKN